MNQVKFSRTAEEKYKLLVNGVLKSINTFLDKLQNNKITINDLKKIIEDPTLYTIKIGDLYLIISKFDDETWGILNILTTADFKEQFKSLIKDIENF